MSRSLDILRANFKYLLEADRDIRQFSLQHHHDILGVLAFFVACFRTLRSVQCLQGRYLLVNGREVLFDDVGELCDFHGLIVKKRFAFGH